MKDRGSAQTPQPRNWLISKQASIGHQNHEIRTKKIRANLQWIQSSVSTCNLRAMVPEIGVRMGRRQCENSTTPVWDVEWRSTEKQTGGRRTNGGRRFAKTEEGFKQGEVVWRRSIFCFNSTTNTRKRWEILVANKIIYLVSNRFYFGLPNGWCFY